MDNAHIADPMPAWHPEDTGPTGRGGVWKCYAPFCGAIADGANRALHDADFHHHDKAPFYERRMGCEHDHRMGECTLDCLHLVQQMTAPLDVDPDERPRPAPYFALLDGTVWYFDPLPRPAAYEMVTYRPDATKRAQRIYLHAPRVIEVARTTSCLSGVEVDADGDEIAPRGADERRHIIDLSLIDRRVRMVMHRDYGMLVREVEQP